MHEAKRQIFPFCRLQRILVPIEDGVGGHENDKEKGCKIRDIGRGRGGMGIKYFVKTYSMFDPAFLDKSP